MFRMSRRQPSLSRVHLPAISLAVCAFLTADRSTAQEPKEPLADVLLGRFACNQASTTEEQGADAAFQLQIQHLRHRVTTSEVEFEALRNKKPESQNDWEKLEIGEFETDSAFQRRKSDARVRAEHQFKIANQNWTTRLTKAAADLESTRRFVQRQIQELTELRNSTKQKRGSVPQPLPRLSRTLTNKDLPLPRFDRELMSFGPMNFVFDPLELQSSRTSDRVRIVAGSLKVQIKLLSLEAAKSFKERVENGDIKCVIDEKIELVRVETPIVVQPEIVKEEETWVTKSNVGRALKQLAVVGIAQAFGASPDQMNTVAGEVSTNPDLELKPQRGQVVVETQKTVKGTRYHVKMMHTAVRFLDTAGQVVPDAIVKVEAVE